MLKTVSSVANALGALNYKGTWNASTNTPTLASGVGTQGDYYVVSVAGATDLDGITNWGVGDWAAFNGSVWQRVEGGADGNFVNLDVIGTTTTAGLLVTDEVAGNLSATVINSSSSGLAKSVLLLSTNGGPWYVEARRNGGDLVINDGSSDIMALDRATGNLDLVSGNLVIGTSGKGIDFSATGTGAGATSELLDDYEEGAWTPVVEGSTTAGTGTYGNQIGLYTKVGRVVHFQCWLQVNSHTGTGVTLIKGLPFTSNSSNAKGTANLNYFANLTISASNTAGLQVANGQTYLILKEFPVGGGVAGDVAIDPNMQINFSGSYTV